MTQVEPNEPRIYSVGELSQGMSRLLEQRTEGLWVEGEVGRVQRSASGHVYFALKDQHVEATLDCVLYKREALRFARFVEEGARIVLRGRASVYVPRGRLQWIGSAVKPSGQGALLALLEALKKRLAAEGLFDAARKRPLPRHPRVVGVVTSRAGAVFHDICTVAARRGRVRIVLSAATVQGEGAPESLLGALDRIEAVPGLDVVIIGRGGGSQEDLSAFNDERVVRRIARMGVPVVSAVGHETDVTLADWVADVRAATPSEAAELVVPDVASQRAALEAFISRLSWLYRARVRELKLRLSRLERGLGDPRFLLVNRHRELGELVERLSRRARRRAQGARILERELKTRLLNSHPRLVVLRARSELAPYFERLKSLGARATRDRGHELARLAAQLDSLSPLAVLGRGYAVAFDGHGKVLVSPREVREGEAIRILVREGEIHATVRASSTEGETT